MENNYIKINEFFISIQGEGILYGTPMLFLRFAGCNFRCNYCDTKYAYFNGERIKIKILFNKIKKESNGLEWISLTGGEPLLQFGELKRLICYIKKINKKIYLETNGSFPERYLSIAKYIDLCAYNIKLNSDMRIKELNFKKYLSDISNNLSNFDNKKLFFKTVVNEDTSLMELNKIYNLILNKEFIWVLQPVRKNKINSKKSISKIINFMFNLKKQKNNISFIKIIPGFINWDTNKDVFY